MFGPDENSGPRMVLALGKSGISLGIGT